MGERAETAKQQRDDKDGEPMIDHEPLESQVDRLARFIIENIDGEPSRSEGAIDTAIRLLTRQHLEIVRLRNLIRRAAPFLPPHEPGRYHVCESGCTQLLTCEKHAVGDDIARLFTAATSGSTATQSQQTNSNKERHNHE